MGFQWNGVYRLCVLSKNPTDYECDRSDYSWKKKRGFMLRVALFLGVFFSVALADDAFCDGWEAGYKSGYCYQKSYCLEPLSPLCPLPRLGEDGYNAGYNRGFLAGLSARR